jgi:signal transduction histidine kinase/DNA-binding response OmpR family regulator
VLDNTIEFTDHITLSHRDYVFSFHFTATEYLRPDKVQFAYRMEGLDNKWFYTDASNRTASYTTLSAGEYQFMVKASSPTGVWSEEYATVNVTINPPWWFSWQAFFVYFVVTAYSIYLFINIRTIKLVKQAKQLEERVSERTQQLQHSRDELAVQSQTVSDLLSQKQQLFASVSHEFRTPLTLILSPVDQMLSRYSDKPLRNDLNLIKRSGKRLLRMVDQLLEFAKLEQDVDHTYEQVSLAQTIDLIVASFEPLLKSNNLDLHISPYEDIIVQVLPDSLNKILLNLLSNAIKYTPEKGQICVTVTQVTSKEGEQVNIEIADNGIGIPEQDQQTVFERFKRATHNHHESVFGAGIGLALVKELIEANQGKISLASQINQGTTFVVTLPVANDQFIPPTDEQHHSQDPQEHLSLEVDSVGSAAFTVEAIPQSVADNQMKTILIIDDNADMRALLCNQLTEHYHCKTAANGQIGISLAKEHLPDLVISDVMMPVMDGYEVAQSLKSDPLTNHIPIILLTAKGSVESRIKGLQLLVDDYLAKPFNLKELLLRINNILTIRDILRKRFAQLINNEPQRQLTQMGLNELDQVFLDKVNDKLSEHYQNSDFNIKTLSEQLLLSERQFQRKLKAVFDLNFPELVRNYRLNKSLEQLKAGYRASNIYDAVGFASHSYFSQCFKAKYGQSPSAYQQSLGGG